MCAETDALFSRSLNLLNELLNRYPSDLPFNDPVRAFVRLLDKHKDNTGIPDEEECYGMLFLVLVQAYAHALGAARELAEALSRQYCHSSACLARIVFEDLITMLYILSDREKRIERARRVYILSYEERAWYLDKALSRKGTTYAEAISRQYYRLAQADPDGYCRLFWNTRYDEEKHRSFFQQLSLPKFDEAEVASRYITAEEIRNLPPRWSTWVGKQKIRNMCRCIDRNKRGQSRLLFTHPIEAECDLYYPALSQLSHGGYAEKDCLQPLESGGYSVRPAEQKPLNLLLLAASHRGLVYLYSIVWLAMDCMALRAGDALGTVLEGIEQFHADFSQAAGI